ncbi:hypothetical protein J4402_01245 [Candidatus Pacearchaeota archaeon]|nr:hypothetical protein [Candidatus Pacearchaeota archaeon]
MKIKKSAQVTIWVIVAMFLVGAVIAAVMIWMQWEPTDNAYECQTNFNCAPATCYDPNECVPVAFIEYPNQYYCESIEYTENCNKTIVREETDVNYYVTEYNVLDEATRECSFAEGEESCTTLPDCDSVIYTPNCDLKINLDSRCGGRRGKCVCDTKRHVCKVEMS